MKKNDSISFPKSLDECTTDGQRIDWLRLRVDELEKECRAYKEDPLYSLYFAEARKANELAVSLNSFVLTLIGDDKSFERYLALKKVQPEILKTLDSLRKDYLKLDEETLAAIIENGVPLIERRAVKTAPLQSKKAR